MVSNIVGVLSFVSDQGGGGVDVNRGIVSENEMTRRLDEKYRALLADMCLVSP